MLRTFNCGVGASGNRTAQRKVDDAIAAFENHGRATVIGKLDRRRRRKSKVVYRGKLALRQRKARPFSSRTRQQSPGVDRCRADPAYPAELALVLSNAPDAGPRPREQRWNPDEKYSSHRGHATRESFDSEIDKVADGRRHRACVPGRFTDSVRRFRAQLGRTSREHPSIAAAGLQRPACAPAGGRGCTHLRVAPCISVFCLSARSTRRRLCWSLQTTMKRNSRRARSKRNTGSIRWRWDFCRRTREARKRTRPLHRHAGKFIGALFNPPS